MIDEMRRHLVRDFPRGGFERAGNTKTHGLVRGELTIHDDMPENLRRGLFATPKPIAAGCASRAPARMSSRHRRRRLRQHQRQGDGCPGREALGRREATQDFPSICTPTFVTPDVGERPSAVLEPCQSAGVLFPTRPAPHMLDVLMQSCGTRRRPIRSASAISAACPTCWGQGRRCSTVYGR